MVDHPIAVSPRQRGNSEHHRGRVGTHRLHRGWRGAGGGDLLCRLQEEGKASLGTGGGAPHPADRSHPSATLARLAQAQLWPDWRYHAFATSTELSPAEADAFHRAHARVELAIRDIKAHAGLSHCPSGNFFANAAWLACTVLAHNLYRWTEHHTSPVGQLTNGNTVRTRLFRLPGRIVNHGGKLILRLPARWPWADTYLTTLASIRSLPQLC